MSFWRYVRDNGRFLLLFVVLTVFIAVMTYLDAQNRMLSGNAIYLAGVSFVLLVLCVSIDYAIKRKQMKRLFGLISAADKTPILPAPTDYKDEVYTALIRNLYEDYMNALHRAEEDYREGTEFMTAWAHEVKTPITAAKLLLHDASFVDEQTQNSLREEVDRIDGYVEKILYYSRSDSFSKDYLIAEEQLDSLAKESVKKHSTLFYRKQIRLENKLPKGLSVYTDKKWLLFIIDQLVSNALKYTPEGGCITLSAYNDERETVLVIEDTGVGIKSGDIARIFAQSFTGHNGRETGSNATGLGLYLSQKLAHKLGHYLTVDSNYGSGTTARIHFPILNDYFNVT